MRLNLSISVTPEQGDNSIELRPISSLNFIRGEAGNAIPLATFSSAPALEVRELGGGQRIKPKQMLEELAALGPGWRLETRQELYALVDLTRKNQHGAYSIDESLYPEPYWTADTHPADASARVVVWFDDGNVYDGYDSLHARARAVRVAGQ